MDYLLDFSSKLNKDYIHVLSNLIRTKQNIYTLGIGKSSNLAKQFSDQLKCISIQSFNLNLTNLLHGDIGCIKKNDLIILISKSGKSIELVNSTKYLKQIPVHIILITMNNSSITCNTKLIIPTVKEIDKHNLIPTNSLICYQYFFNLVVKNLITDDITTLKKNHPSGEIGKKVLTVLIDLLITSFPKHYIDDNLFDVVSSMTKYKIGFCCIVDFNNQLIGIVTDGDIRRNCMNRNLSITKLINFKPITIKNKLNEYICNLKLESKHRYYPVINESNTLLGIYDKT